MNQMMLSGKCVYLILCQDWIGAKFPMVKLDTSMCSMCCCEV